MTSTQEAYKLHVANVHRTIDQQVKDARRHLIGTKIFAIVMTVGLSLLTFSVLTSLMGGVTRAFIIALVIHVIAWCTTEYSLRKTVKDRTVAILTAVMFSIAVYALAVWQGLLWFDGSVIVACLLALIEPAAIWSIARMTAQVQDAMTLENDFLKRTRKATNAITTNPRPARSWATIVGQVRDELIKLQTAPLEDESNSARIRREAKAGHVQKWLELLESYATMEHALGDDAKENSEQHQQDLPTLPTGPSWLSDDAAPRSKLATN